MSAGHLRAGDIFAGRFRIEQPLAEGGMGVLYVVTNLATGHRFALKVLNAEGCFDEEIRKRFLDEARNTPSDASDHIVRVHDTGVADGVPWILMELLDGATLALHVERHGPLTLDALRDVFRQLCHGVAAAHARGVVHRDLKPDNIFLQLPRSALGGRFVKVLDFGVAKALDPSRSRGAASVFVGTHGWWAPEQMLGGMISPSTDVWALGLIAYWCLTGKSFQDTTLPMEATASERARAQGVDGRVAPALDAWFSQCLALEPRQRFRDAEAAWRALDASLPREVNTFATAPTWIAPPAQSPAAPSFSLTPPPVQLPRARTSVSRPSTLTLVGVLAVALVVVITAWRLAPSSAAPAPAFAESPALWSVLQGWNAQLDALARFEPADVGPYYAEQTRFRGSRDAPRPRAWVGDYWTTFFQQDRATIHFRWPEARLTREPLDETREVHSACATMVGADPGVLLVQVPAVEDNPQSAIKTTNGLRCTHIEGDYLLRLRLVGGAYQICHDTWSLDEGICRSCPAARECPPR